MRVANIIEEARVGGPQVRMVRVAAALRGRVETVIFMPRDASGPFRELCDAEGIDYRALPITKITKQLVPALRYLVFSPFEVVMLAWAFRREKIDVVHVSGGSWQYKGVIAARLAGKPVLWHLNDTSMPGFIRRIFRPMSRLATGFIFASERTRDYYRGLCPEGRPEAVVPSVVDPQQFNPDVVVTPSPEDAALIEAWGDDPVVGTVANVNPVKGLETLIRTAAELEQRVPRVHVAIIGQISETQQRYYEELQKLITDLGVKSVTFCGPRADIRPLLRRFDLYVCSSNAESSPVSVWEAMTIGKPVVATDVGDVSLHVRQGEAGYVVEVRDHAELAKHTADLLSNPESLRAFGARGRSISEATFTPTRIADLTRSIYEVVTK